MLIVPYVVAALIVEVPAWIAIAGFIGVILLFFCRAPLALLLKRKSRDGSFGPGARGLWLNFLVFAVVGSSIFFYLIMTRGLWQLVITGVAALTLFAFHEALVWRRRERSVIAELAGVGLLTMTALLAVFLSGCSDCDRLALVLWLLNAMYFGASVFYVKMRLMRSGPRHRSSHRKDHGMGKRNSHKSEDSLSGRIRAARGTILYTAIVISVLSSLYLSEEITALAVAAFLPMFAYQAWGVFTGAGSMSLKAEGVMQTVLSLVFATLTVAAF